MSVNERADIRSGYAFILIFALMTVGIAIIGYIHYQNYERHFRATMESELSSIAELKVGELALWRRERLGDGAVLFKNAAFSALARRYLEKPEDTDAQRKLQEWLGKYHTAYQYTRVALYDTQGIRRMSAPEAPPGPVDSEIPSNVTAILRRGQVVLKDFHRYMPDTPIHLSVVVPIFDERGDNRPLGVLALRIDPTIYLYPFIAHWPTPSQTAETLLVRRDGDDALFLNEIRFHKNAALNLRIPLTKTEVPTVKAVLGQTGIVEGVDYNGAPVIANVSAIPDSPWYMVSKIETSELFAPVRERLWQTLALAGFFLLGAGAAMRLIWSQRDARYREQDKAAEAIHESEGNLNKAQAVGQIGSWRLDIPTNRLEWSAESKRIFGVPSQQDTFDLATFVAVLHPDDRDFALKAWSEAILAGAPYDIEHRIVVNGETRWVKERAQIERDPEGRAITGIGTTQDITERKLAEEALGKSENKYRTLVENIPQNIFYKDRNSVYVSCNKNYADQLKIGVDEIVGKTDFDFSPKELAEKYIADDQRLMKLGKAEDIEEKYLNKGQEKWAHTVKTPIRDESGAVIGILGIFWDITERKLAEEKLRRSESLMAKAQKVARIGHWEWDIRNDTVTWSDEMFRVLGYEPGAITPSMDAFMGSVPPEEKARVSRIIGQSITGGGSYVIDRVSVMPDGTKRIVHAEGTVEYDESGAPFRMFAVVQDVTDSKLMQERLQTQQTELKMQNEELLQTQEALEAARIKYFNLYNLAPVGYFTISGQGLVLETNLTAANLLGVTRNLLVNKPLNQLIVPEDQDVYYLFQKKLFETGASQTLEVKMARQDGSLFWALLEATVAVDTQREAPAWHAAISDITERKQAENRVKLFRDILNLSSDAVLILDVETARPVDFNKVAHEQLGYTREEMFGLSILDIIVVDTGSFNWKDRVKQVKESGGLIAERNHRRKDGSLIPTEAALTVVEMEGKEYLVAVVRDITERIKIRG